ncbi:glycosyltransferase family 4 protein [Halomarina halobia]|uniref:Glycosyltransferase family 4 protein n=1 Tax=Halomarina halobia TaxID=3033386 RepID=A0ABD6A625_9EURY|nr:glycosyltransferase family 4 protein [Halomarina sp. PSR21]
MDRQDELRIALCHSNPDYEASLAGALAADYPGVAPDVITRLSIPSRVSALLRGDYDVIHVDELVANGLLAASTSVVARTPLVVYFRGWDDYLNSHGQYSTLKAARLSLYTRSTLARAAAVMTISERTADMLSTRYRLGEVTACPRPFPVDEYRSAAEGADDGDETTIVTVTNLRYKGKYRGVTQILAALEPIFEADLADRYLIAGDGRYLDRVRARVRHHPFADRIDVLGFQNDVPGLLARADAFAYVSYLDAYPTAVLEAQAAGLPIVAGNASGVPDAVGDAGLVCEPTPDALAEGIRSVLCNPATRRRLSKRARRKAATHNEASVETHIDVWRAVASAR